MNMLLRVHIAGFFRVSGHWTAFDKKILRTANGRAIAYAQYLGDQVQRFD